MNDLISRSALIEWTHQSRDDNPHTLPRDRKIHDHEHDHFLVMLDKAPAVDAEPVVRCKDCAQWDGSECSIWYGFHENDFCSYGERRNGDAL